MIVTLPPSVSLLPGAALRPNSRSSRSPAQNKEVPGVQMGPRHSRRQATHADLRDRPQRVGVPAVVKGMNGLAFISSAFTLGVN